ncbi:MAG: L-arabinose isomerase, partial [Bacteroidia bacterium]
MTKIFGHKEIWFVTGSQHLYGPDTLNRVNEDSLKITGALDNNPGMPVRIVFKPVVTTADEIRGICSNANASEECVGIITWMHTFSPAKMWIQGLDILDKPLLHFHTQFNRDIPWDKIDMNFMNLNQSAHGGREFGFISSRMRIGRKV